MTNDEKIEEIVHSYKLTVVCLSILIFLMIGAFIWVVVGYVPKIIVTLQHQQSKADSLENIKIMREAIHNEVYSAFDENLELNP